jgi:cellulose biosynthesis protein BcsQ
LSAASGQNPLPGQRAGKGAPPTQRASMKTGQVTGENRSGGRRRLSSPQMADIVRYRAGDGFGMPQDIKGSYRDQDDSIGASILIKGCEMNAKTILLFNHKGGVSKTTTIFNLAWTLTAKGKKVLLVDGDPQCNLTGLILGDNFDKYYLSENTARNNIKDAVKVAFEGKPNPIQAVNCYEPITNDRLFLIPGHMDLSEYDSALSLSLYSNNAISTLQNLPGAFYQLISLCADTYKIDYVFIDMNPGLSAINQTFFMCSDAFIIPTNPDPFSLMALKTLKTILPRWKIWLTRSRDYFESASYPLPNTDMKFIGEVIQRFNLRNRRAAAPYQGKIEEIKLFVEDEFVPILEAEDMLYDIKPLIDKGMLTDRCLAEIPEFGAILQKANENNIPVTALTEEQIRETGNVLEQMSEKKRIISQSFDNMANVITELVK